MHQNKLIDHLFRHQYGKMVSILTRIFGLEHLQLIEDAVQDSFYKAVLAWRNNMPDNPEAWLIKSAKNRVIDIFRKINADSKRHEKWFSGLATIAIQEVFHLEEINDSQLRMIFTACHPQIKPEEQICFALKTISGFSTKEIASALLTKEETIKKRLSRARKKIQEKAIAFEIPEGNKLTSRITRVHEILYLIFNEGYHSNRETELVRKDLLAEAMRLCKILLDKKLKEHTTTCALYALMCFHASKADSKLNAENQFINLEHQDRTTWNYELISLGNEYMFQAIETKRFSTYHYEAAIVAEHLKVPSFDKTDWNKILMWYKRLYHLHPVESVLLNIAIVHLQLNQLEKVNDTLGQINPTKLGQRKYLFFSTQAEFHVKNGEIKKAIKSYQEAIPLIINKAEKAYIINKIKELNPRK